MVGKGFTFAFHTGSHTHIFKTRIFNQNSTFKSIELLDRSERKKIFDWFLWIVGDSRCACLLLHLKVAFISLISCPGLAWGSSFLNLLNLLILDYSHQESILAFGCDELHLVPCAECWCECLHKVLFCLELWALALTALTFFLFFCFDWMGDLLVILLWLSLSKSFPIFLSALSAIDRKPCPARICCGTHDGTDRALTLLRVSFLTTSFFISYDVMIDLDARLTW